MRACSMSSSRSSGASPGCWPTRDLSTRPSASSTTGPTVAASTKFPPARRASGSPTGSPGSAAPWDDGYDVIYQMPFIHDGMRGIADFLVRVDSPSEGACRLRAARRQARPHRSQARPRPPAVLLRRRPPRRHGCRPGAHAPLARVGTRSSRSSRGSFAPIGIGSATSCASWSTTTRRCRRPGPIPCAHCEFCEFADRL